MIDEKSDFLLKAHEALASAECDLGYKRYNSAANRAYYACFHAAIAALIDAGVRPEGMWGHGDENRRQSMTTELMRKRQIISKELAEMKRLIKNRYPDAVFRLTEGPEIMRRGLWLNVYTDMADLGEINDLVIAREVDLLERKRFLLSVLPHSLAYLPQPRQNSKGQRAPSYTRPRAQAQARVLRERKATYQTESKKRGAK